MYRTTINDYATVAQNGIRTSKTVNDVTHTYQLNGSQIVSESWGDKLIVYLYDASGAPIGMMYRTTSYAINTFDVFWFEKNLQGDIVAIYNSSGTKVAAYNYSDAWGNHTTSYTNGGASTGAQYNPFRYRGYYYDVDLGMYYLQSRYYDSKICRFINADGYVSTGIGLIGNNMFAYCNNNPVMLVDLMGGKAMPFGELTWPGEIHREVQEYLRDNYGYSLEVYVEGKRIDLVKNGNAYEIKPFTVPKSVALEQLSTYIMLSEGKYIIGGYSPELTGMFISKRGFTVRFYYMGNGIIQYWFDNKSSSAVVPVPEQNENKASVGNSLIAGAVATTTAVVATGAIYGFIGYVGLVPPCKEMKNLTAVAY